MDFIAMDLIGEFHPPSSQGNRYALYMVYTTQVEESIRGFKSLPATRILNTRWKHEDTY